MSVNPLNAAEEDVWRALVRLMILLPRTLDEDLQQEAGLSLTHYIVLMRLSEVPSQQLRMSDLASQAALSPSRMSRIIQSLGAKGLVGRSVSSDDGRAGIATLTPAGLEVLTAAWPTHLASARTIVFDRLDPGQLPEFGGALRRILGAAQLPVGLRPTPQRPLPCGEAHPPPTTSTLRGRYEPAVATQADRAESRPSG